MQIHSTNAARVVAIVASTGLVVASSGFGAVYAYQIGIQHGIVLAGLTVLFAVALELVKPLAIHAAFGAWRWHPGSWPKAVALSVLGLVAVAYSLTAELSLTAASRGDLVAHRDQTHGASSRASTELRALKASRSVGELEALVFGAPTTCRVEVTATSRNTVCGKPAPLLAELARAKRRVQLESKLAASPAVASADPGATALGTYLAAVGLRIDAGSLSQWLTLVPVLALEIGSALAMVLVGAVSPTSPPTGRDGVAAVGREPSREPQQVTVLKPVKARAVAIAPALETRPARLLPDHTTKHREAVGRLILSHLENHGGTIRGNERQLARDLGTTKPTLRRTLQSLAHAGRVLATASKKGTVLQLL